MPLTLCLYCPGDSTVFPCSMARAASWDPPSEQHIASAIGIEARAKWNLYYKLHGHTPRFNAEGLSLTLYAPEINLCRDPRWGRCQASRGEVYTHIHKNVCC